MGGAAKVVTAPFRWASNAVTHVVDHPLDIIPVAVGIATGNPWLAAASTGGMTAVRGGNARQIFTSAAFTGLGSYGGSALGSSAGMHLGRAFGSGSRLYSSAMGQQLGSQIGNIAGTHWGHSSYNNMMNQSAMRAQASTPYTPSMEDMRARAVGATREAFMANGLHRSMYGVQSNYLKMLNKRRPKYGYREWKDLTRRKNESHTRTD